jgi:hypothetical protein
MRCMHMQPAVAVGTLFKHHHHQVELQLSVQLLSSPHLICADAWCSHQLYSLQMRFTGSCCVCFHISSCPIIQSLIRSIQSLTQTHTG